MTAEQQPDSPEIPPEPTPTSGAESELDPGPPPSGDIAEIEADIAATRDRLADAVDALTAKTDVKAQAQAKVSDVKDQAQASVADARDQVRETAEKLGSAASEQAVRAQQAARELPSWVPLAAGTGIVGLLVLIIVRAVRRRRG